MDTGHMQQHFETADPAVIRSMLINLGVMPNYRGYSQSIYAILLAVENPHRLDLVTKSLFPEVAKHFNTNWTSVERNIRTVAGIAWKNNPQLLSKLAGYSLNVQPTSSQFISIITSHCLSCKGSPAMVV